jgi:hypothetical protein
LNQQVQQQEQNISKGCVTMKAAAAAAASSRVVPAGASRSVTWYNSEYNYTSNSSSNGGISRGSRSIKISDDVERRKQQQQQE